ncbi:unnamed protein product [Bursaphelenchus xylophilus]|uniref:(pine wood nematode) hypothetical protein n=1 Tax=Bursaphelenchus xylophilus TaxID=6326 RepID=A0A1I7SC67_BURXY|nr:unnamed protein product [Bursaphelenchus xylophilus]CAG9094655.1 unnamed protein product [Bursaphelenchus xylophilus]
MDRLRLLNGRGPAYTMLGLQIYQTYAVCVLSVSAALCMVVIYISCQLHRQQKNNYSWIVGFNTSVDLFYALVYGVCMPSSSIRYPSIYLMVHNPLFEQSNPTVIRVLVVIRLYVTLIDSPLNGIHFWYRYNAMCRQKFWSWREYIKVYCIVVSLSTAHICMMYYNAQEDRVPTAGDPRNQTINSRHVVYSVTLLRIIVIVYMQLLAVVHYVLIIYFGFHIYKAVRSQSRRSINTTQAAQKALFHVMILQALYPLILFCLPCVLLLSCVLLNIQLGSTSLIMVAPLHLTPILSCISVLTMMPSYRRAFNRLKNCGKVGVLSQAEGNANILKMAASMRVMFLRQNALDLHTTQTDSISYPSNLFHRRNWVPSRNQKGHWHSVTTDRERRFGKMKRPSIRRSFPSERLVVRAWQVRQEAAE